MGKRPDQVPSTLPAQPGSCCCSLATSLGRGAPLSLQA